MASKIALSSGLIVNIYEKKCLNAIEGTYKMRLFINAINKIRCENFFDDSAS